MSELSVPPEPTAPASLASPASPVSATDTAGPAADARPWWVITNPRSGVGDEFDLFAQARYAEHRLGRPIRVRQLNPLMFDLREVLAEAVADGCGRVIVRGGDGTVRSAAQELVGRDVPLAVLPGGTFNNFARNLNIPLEPTAAWELAVAGAIRRIDVGEVNGHVFVNNASLGFYPQMVRTRPRWSGRLGKLLAGTVAAVRMLTHFVAPRLRIRLAGQQVLDETPVVFVGNNRYGGDPTELWRRPIMEEGLLDVHVVRGHILRRLLRQVGAVFGLCRPARIHQAFAAEHFEIHAARRWLSAALDGELFLLETPLRFRARPRSLSVVVPPPTA